METRPTVQEASRHVKRRAYARSAAKAVDISHLYIGNQVVHPTRREKQARIEQVDA
tara:strand:- start:417 stop:584 length:168 start_codon:yes stop_codon:yes gene_type:complete